MLSGHLALTTAALFTGAAVYINIAEQPARLGLDDASLLKQWKPSYKRGFAMQATLAIVGFLFAAMSWYVSNDWRWLLGGLVLLANWPFTVLVIMPTNHQLTAIAPADAGPKSRALIEHWGGLHAVRSALGAVATLIFLWTLGR